MVNRQEYFNPEMLVLARQSRGLTQRDLATVLKVSPGWMSKIEGGIRELPSESLQKISKVLDYPVEFFTSSKRVCGPGISELYHRKRHNVPTRILEKHQAQIEIRRMNLADLLSGVEIGDIGIKTLDLYEFNGSVRDVARAVRAAWRLPRGPVSNVTRAIEEARGMVIPVDFETRLIDATSCWPPNMPPLMFANLNIPGDRLRFSLCHELGHIIMHQDNPNPDIERQANEFAAEFLMPEDDIRPYLVNLSLEKLATLKPYWKVSMAALLQRAREIGEITPRRAKTMWVELGKAGYRMQEPIELDLPVEKPTLMQEILGTYSGEMGYTFSELANLLRLHEHEACHIYFGAKTFLGPEDAKAAIEEAEAILNRYRKQ